MISLDYFFAVDKLAVFMKLFPFFTFEISKRTTGNINHNQCAFADANDVKPFCYTTNRGKRWEYCNCKACDSGLKPTSRPTQRPTQRPSTEGPPTPGMVLTIETL